jgi:hypothetical protein
MDLHVIAPEIADPTSLASFTNPSLDAVKADAAVYFIGL